LYIASCSSVETILFSSNASHQKTNHNAPTSHAGHDSNGINETIFGMINVNQNVNHATAVATKRILLASSGFCSIQFATLSIIG
jgi:hypothetical protein